MQPRIKIKSDFEKTLHFWHWDWVVASKRESKAAVPGGCGARMRCAVAGQERSSAWIWNRSVRPGQCGPVCNPEEAGVHSTGRLIAQRASHRTESDPTHPHTIWPHQPPSTNQRVQLYTNNLSKKGNSFAPSCPSLTVRFRVPHRPSPAPLSTFPCCPERNWGRADATAGPRPEGSSRQWGCSEACITTPTHTFAQVT